MTMRTTKKQALDLADEIQATAGLSPENLERLAGIREFLNQRLVPWEELKSETINLERRGAIAWFAAWVSNAGN